MQLLKLMNQIKISQTKIKKIMNSKIIVIDYGVGNILSIKNAISFHGYTPLSLMMLKKLRKCPTYCFLQGVPSAMRKLKDLNL